MAEPCVAAVETETMSSFLGRWAAEIREENKSMRQALTALLEEVRKVKELQAVKKDNTEAENEENQELNASDDRGIIPSIQRMALALSPPSLGLQNGIRSPFGTPEAKSPALAHLFTVNDKHKALKNLIPVSTKDAVQVFDKLPSPVSQEGIVMLDVPPTAEKAVFIFDPDGG